MKIKIFDDWDRPLHKIKGKPKKLKLDFDNYFRKFE